MQRKVDGAEAYLVGLRTKALTLQDAYSLAIANNPALGAKHQDRAIATHITDQDRAFFDPVIDASLSYTRNSFSERSDLITRERETLITASSEPVQGGLLVPAVDDQGQLTGVSSTGSSICVTVAGELVNPDQCALQTEISTEREFASIDVDAISAWSLDIGVTKRFEWGSQLEVGVSTKHRKKNAFALDDAGLIGPLSLDDPIGRGSRFPWTSSLGATFTTPLPFGKDFGQYGSPQSVIRMLSEIDEQRVDWELRNAREQLLQQTDAAYWNLVRGYSLLQIVLQQVGATRELVEGGRRLLAAHSISRYDMAQLDASLARISTQEQLAWTDLISASNRLNELLDYPDNTLFLPQTPAVDLSQNAKPGFETAVVSALQDNPALKASQMAIQSADLLLRHREIQTKPDFRLSLGVNFVQTDRVLGYETVGDSLSNLLDPDSTDFFVGLSFVYPFGNHAVKSQLSQARLRQKRAQLTVQQDELALTRTTNNVLSRILSTEAQAQHTRAQLDSSELAFEKAKAARDRNEISQFELLQKLNDVLGARTQHLNALIDKRQTGAQLLAVQGRLAATIGGD